MKKAIFLAIVLSVLAVRGASASQTIPYLQCASVSAGPDHGITLSLQNVYGPIHVGQGRNPHLEATVMEETIAGPRELGQFENVQETQSPAMGAPKVFADKNFELVLQVDAFNPHGIPAHLTMEQDRGAKVSEELFCHFTR